MNIVSGANYRRAVTYTERDSDGVQIPLDASDYTAQLIVRRAYDAPVLLDLDSATDPELILSTVDGSVVTNINLGAELTEGLPVGKGYVYTLRLVLTADPDITIVVLNDSASVKATAFSDES